ncbi:helix-turn-helix domain-containing protein [Streptomyces sp. NPDC058316]|uniref:helix-turn-helix domain-containing protein n=1 Tax=Streptomyces sp. NPDC058316 TaxID=3346442 RepID=UPI0036EC5083
MRGVSGVQLGHRLAQLRESCGMKQAELARKVTWSQAVLSRIEAGERPISDDELATLLKAIGSDEAADLATVLDRDWQHLPRPALDHPEQHLLWRAEQMTVALEGAGRLPEVPAAFRTRLDEYVKEISRLAALLLRREHQVAFIGSIGIGKSTVICRAMNLEITGPQGHSMPVLETGAGGVTLCEVHLSRGPGHGIVVEPRTHDDIRSDVEDFVDHITQSRPSGADEDGTPAVPREIERAIRNMAGLTVKRIKGADGKTVRTDPAKQLMAEFPARRDLVVEVLTRMGLHRRDRRDEWHSPALTATPLEWMKSTFEQINNGRHPEFSLPARIDLILPDLLEIDDIDVRLVDTRGIDQPAGRADLEVLLEDPHTVSILCSGFNDAPSASIQHLLQRARDINNTQIDSNASVLVLARPGEALAVKDEAGSRAETAEEGYELKNEQVLNAFTPYRLGGISTFFFNALEDEPEGLRTFLRERVTQTRDEFQRQLDDVLDRTQFMLDNAEQEQVQAVQREAGRLLATWIKQHPTPARLSGHVHDALLNEIERAHAASVNAAVRRDGEWRSLSYTHQLGHGARRAAVTTLQAWVTGFTDLCQTLSDPDSMPEARELLSQAQQLMSTAYDELLRKVQLTGLTLYRDQLREDPQFWNDNAGEWGQGPGYLNRVLGRNREWFQQPQRRDLEDQLAAVLEHEWHTVLERVEAIFGQA